MTAYIVQFLVKFFTLFEFACKKYILFEKKKSILFKKFKNRKNSQSSKIEKNINNFFIYNYVKRTTHLGHFLAKLFHDIHDFLTKPGKHAMGVKRIFG